MIGLDLKALCCVGACCLSSVGAHCAYRNRQKIPHPSECNLIGKCYLVCGCHKHQKFDMLIEIHELQDIPGGSKCLVQITSGRFTVQTQFIEEKKGKCDIQERLNLHVRQCDECIKLVAYRKGTLPFLTNSNELGSLDINVKEELIEVGFPKRRWYYLKNIEGKTTVKVHISFHKLDSDGINLGDLNLSPLVQQALLHAQYEAESEGKKLNVNMHEMGDVERLRFYSKVLEGPLKKLSSVGAKWSDFYFKAVEKKDGSWEWQYWNSKEECVEGYKKKGSYSFLAISLVLPDSSDRHCFFIKYHNLNGVHELYFKRVDRDRNLWSDGLYEFIEKLRSYLEKTDEMDRITSYIRKKEKKMKKLDSARSAGISSKDATSPRSLKTGDSSNKSFIEFSRDVRRLATPRESLTLSLEDSKLTISDSGILSSSPSTRERFYSSPVSNLNESDSYSHKKN